MSGFREIFHGGPTSSVDLERLQDKLLFSLPPVRDRYARFFILLVLSTIIATGGLIGNSPR